MEAYLRPSTAIDFDHAEVSGFLGASGWKGLEPWDAARAAFLFVRDEVAHSYDARNPRLTLSASDALRERTGLCYAKSHLLAAFLRGLAIPAALRYQRLLLGDDPADGYCLHAFNAAWLDGRWVDLDARGNNGSVWEEFSRDGSRLAFDPRPERGESTYAERFAEPAASVIRALSASTNALTMVLPATV